jgi:hypothetical protein
MLSYSITELNRRIPSSYYGYRMTGFLVISLGLLDFKKT